MPDTDHPNVVEFPNSGRPPITLADDLPGQLHQLAEALADLAIFMQKLANRIAPPPPDQGRAS